MRASLFGLCLAMLLGISSRTAAEPPLSPASEVDPWSVLVELRSALVDDSPLTVAFEQTFTPAGFSTGDRESGALSIALPDCLRWDYRDPFPRSFLLCDDLAYSWNPGEASGRLHRLTEDERQGTDLLRLRIEELQQRYRAATETLAERIVVHLEPLDGASEVTRASLVIGIERTRLLSIAYEDLDGNSTTFELTDYRSTTTGELFSPPIDVEWIED